MNIHYSFRNKHNQDWGALSTVFVYRVRTLVLVVWLGFYSVFYEIGGGLHSNVTSITLKSFQAERAEAHSTSKTNFDT